MPNNKHWLCKSCTHDEISIISIWKYNITVKLFPFSAYLFDSVIIKYKKLFYLLYMENTLCYVNKEWWSYTPCKYMYIFFNHLYVYNLTMIVKKFHSWMCCIPKLKSWNYLKTKIQYYSKTIPFSVNLTFSKFCTVQIVII